MIVTLGGIKGGVGKSLISVNLAVLRSLDKKKILLVDGDDQGTTSDWVEHRFGLGIETPWTTIRLKGASVRNEILKMKQDYDDVIIDCGGRDTVSLRAALTITDLFLIPFQPKSFDIWTISQVSHLTEEARVINPNLIASSFINCGEARGNDNEEAKEILKEINGIHPLNISVGHRKAFSNATAKGLGVVELKPQDKKACSEIKTLYRYVFEGKKTSKR